MAVIPGEPGFRDAQDGLAIVQLEPVVAETAALGSQVARHLLFPLLILVFAIPGLGDGFYFWKSEVGFLLLKKPEPNLLGLLIPALSKLRSGF